MECELGAHGLVVSVRYHGSIHETDNPEAVITRMVVYADGRLLEDSGPISSRVYEREVTFSGLSSRLHTIQLHTETWGAPQPKELVQFAQCPPTSGVPQA